MVKELNNGSKDIVSFGCSSHLEIKMAATHLLLLAIYIQCSAIYYRWPPWSPEMVLRILGLHCTLYGLLVYLCKPFRRNLIRRVTLPVDEGLYRFLIVDQACISVNSNTKPCFHVYLARSSVETHLPFAFGRYFHREMASVGRKYTVTCYMSRNLVSRRGTTDASWITRFQVLRFSAARWMVEKCDMIKRNESDIGHIVFEILSKTVF